MPMILKPSKLQYADYKHVKADAHVNYIEQILPT
jgi:hypothetical protein